MRFNGDIFALLGKIRTVDALTSGSLQRKCAPARAGNGSGKKKSPNREKSLPGWKYERSLGKRLVRPARGWILEKKRKKALGIFGRIGRSQQGFATGEKGIKRSVNFY